MVCIKSWLSRYIEYAYATLVHKDYWRKEKDKPNYVSVKGQPFTWSEDKWSKNVKDDYKEERNSKWSMVMRDGLVKLVKEYM